MITIVAGYVSGDRDNHRCGLAAAVCNLFNNEARRQGLVPVYECGPRTANDTAEVTYTVRTELVSKVLTLLIGCADRGLPTRTHLFITADTEEEAAILRRVGYYPARGG